MTAALRVGAVLLWLLAAGCRVGPQAEPEPLTVDLGGESFPVDADGDADPSDELPFAATIYLVDEADELVPVSRDLVAANGRDERLAAVVEALLAGPDAAEAADGLRSAVPVTSRLVELETDGSLAVVDLSDDFASVGGPTELLAVGQVVLTATTVPGTRTLQLRLDGADTALPLPDGALTEDPVTLAQYASLLSSGP